MGSRRMTRSSFSNGRSSSGEDSNGTSRPNGCSYSSNVRPENRSTLCMMKAQLTEETQPFFEATLKSKAVSENCNVKFSCVVTGHPAPQLVWYKEDVQLDRYCGLPKYEIAHNGHHHSLHIYNCTLEDAAIYQASASNNKGIVSCFGLLEVGEMNEFKIHQRYFAKLKQKAHRYKEEAGKKKLEPLRTISPDHTLRKRYSSMQGFLSVLSSMEDEGREETPQAVENELEETLTSISNVSGTYTYNSAQKIFTANQPKSPFTKKIKISQDEKGQRVSGEQRAKVEGSKCGTMTSEEIMEVDDIFTSLAVVDSRNVTESQKEKEVLTSDEKPSKAVSENGAIGAPEKAHLMGSKAGPGQTAQATEGKGHDHKVTEEPSQMQKFVPDNKIAKLQQIAAALQPSKAQTTDAVPVSKTEDKSETSSAAAPDSRAGLSLCGWAGDQLSYKETGPCQKNLSETCPGLLREVTQARKKMSRNDAPVSLEVPLNHRSVEAQPPQKSPSQRDTPADDIKSLTFSTGSATGKMVKDRWDHSSGNGSRTLPFTDIQKSSLQNPGTGQTSRGCKVLPRTKHIQVDTGRKTVQERGKQVETKVGSMKVGESTRSKSKILLEKVEIEHESVDHQQKIEKQMKLTTDKEIEKNSDRSEKQSEKNELTLKKAKKNILHRSSNIPEKTSQLQAKDSQNHQPTPPKVISIAELLRTQIKALDSMLANSLAQEQASIPMQRDLKGDESQRIPEVNTSNRKTEDMPLRNIKETLMEVYQQLQRDQEQLEVHDVVLEAVQPSEKIPPTSAVETGTTAETNKKMNGLGRETGAALLSDLSRHVSPETDTGLHIPIVKHDEDKSDQDKRVECLQKSSSVDGLMTQNGTSENLSDHSKIDKLHMENNVQMVPPEIEQVTHLQPNEINKQDRLMVEDLQQTHTLASLSPKTSPLLKSHTPSIPAANEQELASGARRKFPKEKTSPDDFSEAPSPVDNQVQIHNPSTESPKFSACPPSLPLSPSLQKRSQQAEQTPSLERHSPVFSRRKIQSEDATQSQKTSDETHIQKTEDKLLKKKKHDPFKAPQVIRKIRSETFADASGHLKLWCQFFNVLTDSTIRWSRDEEDIAQVKRSAGDETQVNLAVVQASHRDSGVYRCTITNEYGTDSTDCLLSAEILTGMSICEDLGVGEEIEMTPMIFSKGVADSGVWGNKFFGRVVMQESHIGDGCLHKVWRAKVIYGLEPVFESGHTCIVKVRNYISYSGKGENCLTDKNLEMITQECKIQNLAREYCKIFSAEARVIDNFGPSLEVLPVYLMYRPANAVPYVTVEADLPGDYQRFSVLDQAGRLDMRTGSDVEQKCCALQHWIFQWTNGNMLLTRLEGIDMKITNVGISVKSTGFASRSVC
ncbi:alpha-protein kinase 3 isoform X2 [Takifugu flavidus]|uniref:alpha-protein kinase 3 isoform X2 n=1 Tax=Takifugu flavidus TaxID=433684 RepID=UPI00254497C3|nr:alpha-protein kinase 3 isoform X2 [Takifugu flavidus]